MASSAEVLLVDDGELHDVAQLLESIGVPFSRRCGEEPTEPLAPPQSLVIATPARAASIRRGSPPGARRDRPVRIIAADEDSPAMRRRMQRLGFQFLVRQPAHTDLWQMLIERALRPESDPALDDASVPVTTGRTKQRAMLLDLANRGCRLQSQQEFRAGAQLDFELGLEAAARQGSKQPLRLSGMLMRVSGELDGDGRPRHSAAMHFDGLQDGARQQLAELLNNWSVGESSFSQASAPELPACESPVSPGLTLDDETDPPLRAELPVELRLRPDSSASRCEASNSDPERRLHTRSDFPARILAQTRGSKRVLVGRDISAGGMRVEGSPGLREGARCRLELYGPAEIDPYLLSARVVRDDGPGGLALSFEAVSDELAEKLEKLVSCLPQLQSLEADEASQLGAVISRILAED